MEKNEQNVNSKENQMPNLLVGYVRRSQAGKAVNVSINTNAFGDCLTYCTDDGQRYVSLVISLDALRKVIEGERIVTTVSQLILD